MKMNDLRERLRSDRSMTTISIIRAYIGQGLRQDLERLEFDEEAPYILAVPVFDEEAMRAVVGCTRGRLGKTSDEWLDETRGGAE